MDVHQNVISKIICDQVLNSNMPDHIKQHVSKLMMKNGESYINLILCFIDLPLLFTQLWQMSSPYNVINILSSLAFKAVPFSILL